MTEELDNLERDTLEPSWQEAVNKEFSKPYFKQVQFIHNKRVYIFIAIYQLVERVPCWGTQNTKSLPVACVRPTKPS